MGAIDMPDSTTKTTSAEHLAEVAALTHVLVDISGECTHQVALEALISAYTAVAVTCPCCTRGAAHLARNVAALIESRCDAQAEPHSTPHIH